MRISEAIGGKKLSDIKRAVNKTAIEDEEKKKEYMRKTNIRAMRDLDRLDQLVPDIFNAMNELFPEISVVKEVEIFEDKENTFYIDDDLRLWIHKDFVDREDVKRLLELCEKVEVFMIVGDVWIVNLFSLKELPKGFPKEIKGHFKLQNLMNLRNLNNAPRVIYGGITPTLEIKSRYIRPAMESEYANSLRDKQNNAVDPLTVLKKQPNTYMNNIIRESEIQKRITLGHRFLNENFPSNLSRLFKKPVRPVEPKYPDLPDEENVPEKRLANMKAKRQRGMEKYEKKTKTYNDILLPLYNKNIEIFREVITPLLDAGWGSIANDDVKLNDTYEDIHKDLKDNVVKFQGVKIFADDHNNITMIYAKTENDDKCRIIYFTDDNGNDITETDALRNEIVRRDKVYKYIHNYFVDRTGFKWDDVADRRDTDIRRALLCMLWWMISNGMGIDRSGKKQFSLDAVIYNPNHEEYDVWAQNCLNELFNGKLRPDTKYTVKSNDGKDVYYSFFAPSGKININPGKSNGPEYASRFADSVCWYLKMKNELDSFNPAEYISDDVIKSFLMGLSIRAEYSGRPIYEIPEILDADRETLLDMISHNLDVNIFSSSLKYMSYKGKDTDVEVGSANGITNPQGVLMLFPDKCREEFVVTADIKKSILDNYIKRETRKTMRSGSYNPSKRIEYDYKTRTRKEVETPDSNKRKGAEMTALDQFEQITDYFSKDNLKAVENAVKKSVTSKIYNMFKNALSKVSEYPSLIIDDMKSNPEKENDMLIDVLIDTYTELEDKIENIYRAKEDDIVSRVRDFMRKAEVVNDAYNRFTGYQGMKRRAAEIAAKKSYSSKMANEPVRGIEADAYDTSELENVAKSMSNDYTTVKRILNTLDFSKAHRKAVRDFGSKDSMSQMFGDSINGVLSMINNFIGSGDADKLSYISDSVKELGNILSSIVQMNEDNPETSDEAISRAAAEFYENADDILDDVKKYASSKKVASYTA